jgi:hypothetical protein
MKSHVLGVRDVDRPRTLLLVSATARGVKLTLVLSLVKVQ